MVQSAGSVRFQRRGARRLSRLEWQVLACVAVAAASMVVRAELEYDPWTWLVWARETTHMNLVTSTGPAWKPLPYLVDLVLMPLGGAAPWAWELVVRAAGFLALLAAGRVAGLLGRPRPLAAGAAVLGVALSAQLMFGLVPRGYSEPILGAALLFAAETALRRRVAMTFGLLLVASLVRPEAWPLLLIAGAYAVYRRGLTWPPVVACVTGVGLLWVLPDYLGSGEWTRSAARAAIPSQGGPLLTAHPALAVLNEAIHTPALPWLIAFVATLVMLARKRWSPLCREALVLLSAATIGWALLAAALVGLHRSSGEMRYLIGWTVGVPVIAAVGVTHLWSALTRRVSEGKTDWRRARAALVALAVLCIAAVSLRLEGLRRDLDNTRNYTTVQRDLKTATSTVAVPPLAAPCGAVATEPYSVPALAWLLNRGLQDVGTTTPSRGVVFAEEKSAGQFLPSPPPEDPMAVVHRWYVWRTC